MRPRLRFNRRLLGCAAGGVAVQSAGEIFLAGGFQSVAEALAIYPGSLIFYLLPRAIVNRLSEPAAFWLWFLAGAVVWASVLLGLSLLVPQLRARLLSKQLPGA